MRLSIVSKKFKVVLSGCVILCGDWFANINQVFVRARTPEGSFVAIKVIGDIVVKPLTDRNVPPPTSAGIPQ